MIGRVALLAPAPSAAQRRLQFPHDEPIEPIDRATTERLRAAIPRYGEAWRGPERRAAETAAALDVAAQPVPALRAWSMGDWSGMAVAAVAERDPAAFDAWRSDPAGAPPSGESLLALTDRVGSWLDRPETSAARSFVVADASVVRAMIVFALGLPTEAFWRFDVAPLSFTVLQCHDGVWRARMTGAAIQP